jgi:hypothetical protein
MALKVKIGHELEGSLDTCKIERSTLTEPWIDD